MTQQHDQIPVDGDAFLAWLQEYPRGQLGLELSEGLRACVTATQLYEKASTLTLKITIGPGAEGYGDLLVKPEVTAKPAKPAARAMTFFPTENGGLSRRDPNQPTLPGVDR